MSALDVCVSSPLQRNRLQNYKNIFQDFDHSPCVNTKNKFPLQYKSENIAVTFTWTKTMKYVTQMMFCFKVTNVRQAQTHLWRRLLFSRQKHGTGRRNDGVHKQSSSWNDYTTFALFLCWLILFRFSLAVNVKCNRTTWKNCVSLLVSRERNTATWGPHAGYINEKACLRKV